MIEQMLLNKGAKVPISAVQIHGLAIQIKIVPLSHNCYLRTRPASNTGQKLE
jgi:hypothetical protein